MQIESLDILYVALGIALFALWRACRLHAVYQQKLMQFEHKTREAQRIFRQRGSLATELAHEIKNPITAILCSAETLHLLLADKLDEPHRKSLQYMKEYGDHLLRLLSDFLDISRLEAGFVAPKPEVVSIIPFIESVVGLLQANAQKKHIEVSVVETRPGLTASVDPKHLKQIVFNLVHNAIKFTPRQGEITIIIASEFPAPFVSIEVSDTGIGIPADELDKIFDLYARYEGNQPETDLGMGMGLALCKSLVEMGGGSMSVESRVNIGTTFTFTLPRGTADEREKEPVEQEVLVRPLEGQRFLLVGEGDGPREAVAQLIEAWGGLVDQVDKASEAVRALTQLEYDAVMVSETTEGMSAHAAGKLIRNELGDHDTKIIVAGASKGEAQENHHERDVILEKPLNGKTLLESLLRSGKYSVTH